MPGEKVGLLSIILVVIFAAVYVYYFILPNMTVEYDGEKPILKEDQQIQEEHIEYIVTELGVTKLRNSPNGDPPEIEIYVTDEDRYFTVDVMNGEAEISLGYSVDPDIRISGTREVVAELLLSDGIIKKANEFNNQGKITFEILKGIPELASKGYQSLHNELT